MDFIRGAALAPEGRAIIALPVDRGRRRGLADRARARAGRRRRDDPRPRPDGRDRVGRRRAVRAEPPRARAALIAIAHPDFRDDLNREARRLYHV